MSGAKGTSDRIADIGCGPMLACVFVAAGVAVAIRLVRWGLS